MNKDDLKSVIKKLVTEVLDEENLDEMSVTANVAGYQTPYAFVDRRQAAAHEDEDDDEEEDLKEAEGDKDISGYTEVERYSGKLKEGRSNYHNFRDHPDMSPRQKVSYSIREVNNMLSEVEKLIDMNCRLKTEMGVDSGQYWKRAQKQMNYISERLERISEKFRGLR